jgi:hypothetical protein
MRLRVRRWRVGRRWLQLVSEYGRLSLRWRGAAKKLRAMSNEE